MLVKLLGLQKLGNTAHYLQTKRVDLFDIQVFLLADPIHRYLFDCFITID